MRGGTQGSFLLPLYSLAVHPVFDAVMMGVVVINVIFMAGAHRPVLTPAWLRAFAPLRLVVPLLRNRRGLSCTITTRSVLAAK